jgi:mRNA deadenylase 3'-5' endonuclease subunit Ccr4
MSFGVEMRMQGASGQRDFENHCTASRSANHVNHDASGDAGAFNSSGQDDCVDGVNSAKVPGTSESRPMSEMCGFSVMSYNILADRYAKVHAKDLYSSVPKTCMKWSTRASLIAREISHWSPDIVCLQEVDRFKHLQSLLNRHGYQGKYLQRSSGRPDGLAMFWKQGKLALERTEEVCFASHGLRDNVAQVCALRILKNQGDDLLASSNSMSAQHETSLHTYKKRKKPLIVVTNIHVLFNPKRGDIKLGQVRILLEKLGQVASAYSDGDNVPPPAILCGDFNSSPTSALHQYITTGFLNVHSTHRSDVSGQVACSRKAVTIAADDEPKVELKRKRIKPWKAEEIEIATGRSQHVGDGQHSESSGSMSHPMSIRSSYAKVMGEEPTFSTAHDKYVGTVDYIFYTDGDESPKWSIRPVQVLAPPPLHKILPKGLPNGFWPSDHISLCTKFILYASEENRD